MDFTCDAAICSIALIQAERARLSDSSSRPRRTPARLGSPSSSFRVSHTKRPAQRVVAATDARSHSTATAVAVTRGQEEPKDSGMRDAERLRPARSQLPWPACTQGRRGH
jgi:hypothetical protein